MTSRTTDIHCDKCHAYMYSVYPRDPLPDRSVCDRCREKVAPPPPATPQEASRAAFEAWAADRSFGQNYDRTHYSYVRDDTQSAWIAWQARDSEIQALRDALTLLCTQFPTDDDMQAAGWSTTEINGACDAYDKARAALEGK